MANQVATQNNQGTALGRVSDKFANLPMKDELGAGIQSSFGLIGYRGKVWSIKYRGDEEALMREDGDGPANSLEVVIVQSSENISKTFYVDGYVEGSNAAPDCYSNNGLTPEPNSPKLQNPVCATCPHNIWGSKVTPAGKQGKACADNKRLAVVPQADISNEVYGGPMLLRVPAASLQDLAQYGAKMHQLGYPYFGIATRISFDVNQAYPKFLFKGIRTLTDEEAELVLTMRNSTAVNRVLSENIDGGTPSVQTKTPANPLEEAFEQPPQDQSNGAASSTPAQSAGVNGNTTQQASANILVPDTQNPQETTTTKSNGTANPVPAKKSSGFNTKKNEVEQKVATQPQPEEETSQESKEETSGELSADDLDAQLDKLIGA